LFEEAVRGSWFKGTRCLLVLNHFDRFCQLLPLRPFPKPFFPDAPKFGAGQEREGVGYIAELFLKVCRDSQVPEPTVVITTLVDPEPIYLYYGQKEAPPPKLKQWVADGLPVLPPVLIALVTAYAQAASMIPPSIVDLMVLDKQSRISKQHEDVNKCPTVRPEMASAIALRRL